ncbi:MAG: hypothetical protein IJ242_15605 [Clostridia bacterium]|nr:hypothetical protein [Clostridia bacterium]
MKRSVTLLLTVVIILTGLIAYAEEEIMIWAYGAMPLNNGNVGIIFYTAAYYKLEGIKDPASPEFAPYTAEEIAVITNGAANYRFDAPANALIGVTVADSDVVFWYDATNAAAIVSHADPLTLDTATGAFATAEGVTAASPIK